jgi:hypothetical protein
LRHTREVRLQLSIAAAVALLFGAALLFRATRRPASGPPAPAPTGEAAADQPRAARLVPKRPPASIAGSAPLVPLPAATLAYYDRPGVRVALLQVRSAARRRCSSLVQYPPGERRLTFRIGTILSSEGTLDAVTVEPDGVRAADCIRKQMSTVHLPPAGGPTPLQINLSFLY